jgi:hypothetical protein
VSAASKAKEFEEKHHVTEKIKTIGAGAVDKVKTIGHGACLLLFTRTVL